MMGGSSGTDQRSVSSFATQRAIAQVTRSDVDGEHARVGDQIVEGLGHVIDVARVVHVTSSAVALTASEQGQSGTAATSQQLTPCKQQAAAVSRS